MRYEGPANEKGRRRRRRAPASQRGPPSSISQFRDNVSKTWKERTWLQGGYFFFQAGNHAPLELSCFAALRVIATLFAVVLIAVEEETLLHIGMEAFLPLSFLRPRHPYREHASLPRRAHLLLFGQNYPPLPRRGLQGS